MAQSTLHFALGMTVGSLWAVPGVLLSWKKHLPLTRVIGRWLLLAYGLGLYATLPSILRRVSSGAEWATGGWTHIFLLYPLIEKLNAPSIALGELAIAACFAAQYGLILLAIHRAKGLRPIA
jgi:hypothetical protein